MDAPVKFKYDPFCIPVKREKKKIWRIVGPRLGAGVYGSVYAACKNTDCSYVFKIIPLSLHHFTVKSFDREVRAQQILARLGLALEVIDSWVCSDTTVGVIIMRVLDMTAGSFLKDRSGATIEDHIALIKASLELLSSLHEAGYYHGDPHLDNIMLKKVSSMGPHTFNSSLGYFRVYFVDMGRTGSLSKPGKFMKKSLTAESRITSDIDYLELEFMDHAKAAVKKLEWT